MQTIATRYKGIVHNYERWNEPDLSNSYTGDVNHMVALCQAAYTALKAIDPTITFTSPSFCPKLGTSFMQNYLASGGVGTFDILNFHYYANYKTPESTSSMVTRVSTILNQDGIGNTPIRLILRGHIPFVAAIFTAGPVIGEAQAAWQRMIRMYLRPISWESHNAGCAAGNTTQAFFASPASIRRRDSIS